jgi:NADP-dependent 3-hydroxy acid dehydrogenase YdfG
MGDAEQEPACMSYFTARTAVVTGAGSGIGRALAQELNAAGCALWLSDIDGESLAATVAAFTNNRAPWHCAHVDVADRAAMCAWAAEVTAATDAVDLLVNNAGVALIATAEETSAEDFHWLMNINFWGVVHGCEAFLPALKRAERGHLVNISSVFGIIGVPTQSAYNAAKFAVRGYSESLAQELELDGSGVRVCCVHPGGIDTNIARRARNADRRATAESQHAQFAPHIRTSPDAAARQILRAAERGQRRLLIGLDAHIIDWLARLFPAGYARLTGRAFRDSEARDA